MLSNLVHKALWKLTETFPNRTRIIKVEGKPYLRRFYLTPRRLDEHGEKTGKDVGFGVYLHYFYRGDEDRELHNHPWEKALSFILCSGYYEERRDANDNVILKNVRPFTFNYITSNDFHRVIKKEKSPHIWTLFMTGKRIQDWGFWDRDSKEYIPHKKFVVPEDQGYK
jgi:hypothetical protein